MCYKIKRGCFDKAIRRNDQFHSALLCRDLFIPELSFRATEVVVVKPSVGVQDSVVGCSIDQEILFS